MSNRKPIGKKLRFEVFKRDSFTCQYCGGKSPDVVLHVDHINPVSKGGDNDILNLITSCFECNSGKGARVLSVNKTLDAQRAQLDELNERRQQIEWMIEWRTELSSLKDDTVSKVSAFWSSLVVGYYLNELGKQTVAKWLKRFDLSVILESMDEAASQYLEFGEGGKATQASVNKAFDMISRIASIKVKEIEKPYLGKLFYIRAILRNRLAYINEREAMDLMENAVELHIDIESLQDFAKRVRNWTQFRDGINSYIASMRDEG